MQKIIENLSIVRLSDDFRGIAYDEDGRIVLLEGALPGEVVTAQVYHRKKKYLEANTIAVEFPSVARQKSDCAYANDIGKSFSCGGCQMRHMNEAFELELKSNKVKDLLEIDDSIWELPISGNRFHYRTKARLAVRYHEKDKKVLIGFREQIGHKVMKMDSCPVLIEPVSGLLGEIALAIEATSLVASIPQIELIAAYQESGDFQTGLILRVLQIPTSKELQILGACFERHGIRFFIQTGGMDTIVELDYKGEPLSKSLFYAYLPEYDIRLGFSPGDFTQVNWSVNRQMVVRMIDWLAIEKDEKILDLFAGMGNFSLPIAKQGAFVHAVEDSEAMVKQAQLNAEYNNLASKLTAEKRDLNDPEQVEACLRQAKAAGFQKMLLDPPRSGAKVVIEQIAHLMPLLIAYVSCDPMTLKRDIQMLEEQGYRKIRASMVNMFPGTRHIESTVLLELNDI